jgi:hypothetical protein
VCVPEVRAFACGASERGVKKRLFSYRVAPPRRKPKSKGGPPIFHARRTRRGCRPLTSPLSARDVRRMRKSNNELCLFLCTGWLAVCTSQTHNVDQLAFL